jgi:hypothetical protein
MPRRRQRERDAPDGITEYTPLQEAALVDADGASGETQPTIVTLIRAGSNESQTTHYTPEFLQRTVADGFFSGALMRLNHPSRSEQLERPEGDLGAVASRTGDAYWDPQEQAVKAPVVWLAGDIPGSRAQLVQSLFRDPAVASKAGLSIHWPGRIEWGEPVKTADGTTLRNPKRLLQTPGASMYVDYVAAPAAGGRVPHLASIREEDAPMPDLADLTLDELTTQRPDLIESIRALTAPPPAATQPPTPPPEPVPPVDIGSVLREALAPIATRLDALETSLATAEGTSRVNALIETAGLQEAAASVVRAELSGRTFDTEEQLQEAFAVSVARINALMESIGAPQVSGLGAEPPADQTAPVSAADALREAGLLPKKDGD